MRVSNLKIGLLYYLVGTEQVSVVLLDQSGASHIYALPNWAEIFPLADALQDALAGSYSNSYKINILKKFSIDWGKKLLPPWAEMQAYDVLVIVPPPTLYGLPFHAVQFGAESRFLGEMVGISYCSSGSLFQLCVSRNAARLADLSAWDFSTEDGPAQTISHAVKSCLVLGTDVLHDQDQGYRKLSEDFSTFFPLVDNAGVTPRAVMKEPKHDVVCLICHGHYDESNPDNCGLLLGNPTQSVVERPIMLGSGAVFNFRDLPLRPIPMEVITRPGSGAELFTVNEMKIDAECRAELVALLGCSTASGSPVSIDEPGTLAEQWLRSGAASVLANFWEIDLVFLHKWNQVFLTNWVTKRQPKAIAWRETIIEILGKEPDRSVYEWGCISVLGDWL